MANIPASVQTFRRSAGHTVSQRLRSKHVAEILDMRHAPGTGREHAHTAAERDRPGKQCSSGIGLFGMHATAHTGLTRTA